MINIYPKPSTERFMNGRLSAVDLMLRGHNLGHVLSTLKDRFTEENGIANLQCLEPKQ